MFQARRPFSSSELLSRRKLQIEQTLNKPPSINLQDSSEQTARTRKMASVLESPYGPVKGSSTTMVKYSAASVVQAMVEGQSYRTSATHYQPRVAYTSPGCSNLLNDPVTFPKAITCSHPISNSHHVVEPFNTIVAFGYKNNDNKVVIANAPKINPQANCDIY